MKIITTPRVGKIWAIKSSNHPSSGPGKVGKKRGKKYKGQ